MASTLIVTLGTRAVADVEDGGPPPFEPSVDVEQAAEQAPAAVAADGGGGGGDAVTAGVTQAGGPGGELAVAQELGGSTGCGATGGCPSGPAIPMGQAAAVGGGSPDRGRPGGSGQRPDRSEGRPPADRFEAAGLDTLASKLSFVEWLAGTARDNREAAEALEDIEALERQVDPESEESRRLADLRIDLEDRRGRWEAQERQPSDRPQWRDLQGWREIRGRWWDLRKFGAVEGRQLPGTPPTAGEQPEILGTPPTGETARQVTGTPPSEAAAPRVAGPAPYTPEALDPGVPPTTAVLGLAGLGAAGIAAYLLLKAARAGGAFLLCNLPCAAASLAVP